MALDLGELSIALKLDNDRFTRGLAGAKTELQTLTPAAQREMVGVSRVMDSEGRKAGGTLSKGINAGLIRNSPLIVAGVAAALAAGGPAALAGAGVLFGGIGIAAAAQSKEVQSAWVGTWNYIREAAIDDAQVLEGTLVGTAGREGDTIDRLRPQVSGAFADSAPLIDSTADGILRLAENAMPGLTRAIAQGQPVFSGLEHFLGTVGYGTTEFLDAISSHSPAAGSALASLGDITGDLLPIVGELLGQGAELASDVLPAVSAATGVTLQVLQALGPLLPTIALGFAGMKIAGVATVGIASMSTGLATVAQRAAEATYSMDGFAGSAAGKASTAASRTGRAFSTMGDNIGKAGIALPALGIVIAGIASDMSDASNEEDRWAQAILAGGQAASDAYKQYSSDTHWGQAVDEATGLSSSWEDAKDKADEMRAAMTPLQRAQADATAAENELTAAIDKHGPASDEAKAASVRYRAAQGEVEEQSGRTQLALHGVTQAMLDQANQALAAIDSSFGYQNSLNQLEDAQADYNAALTEFGANSEEAQRASLALAEQNYQTALAFGQQQADMSGAGKETSEYARIVQETALQELYRLRDAAGPELAGALSQQIAMLEASGVSLNGTGVQAQAAADRMKDLGLSVTQMPGYKGVFIDAPTEDQRSRIEDLGYKVVNLPDGSVYVAADTADALRAITALTATRTIRVVAQAVDGIGGRLFGGAAGGNVGAVARGVKGFSGGGRLSGPGTPTSDSIPAITFSGVPLRVADDEWIIKARSAAQYGDRAMSAVNAGTARIITPGAGYAAGGPIGGSASAADALAGGIGTLLHADEIHIIEGTPRDLANELAIRLRTGGV